MVMKIEIWSDVYCPFCYMGETVLKQALAKYPEAKDIELEFKSFELDPTIPQGTSYPVIDYVAKKYGFSRQQSEDNSRNIELRAKQLGVDLDFSTVIVANTFDAHRLIQFAQDKGAALPMVERLFKAQFQDGLDVGNREVLAQLASEVGFNAQEVLDMLESKQYMAQVKVQAQEGVELGVRSVPFFIFDRKVAVSGAQPENVFEDAIEEAFGFSKAEVPTFKTLGEDNAGNCGPEGCQL